MLIQENVLEDNKGCVLDNFKLVNRDEIINFIDEHNGLLELIEKSYPLVRKYFPKYSYCLLYSIDPEILNLEHLMLFINGDEDFYDEDCLRLRDLEKEIDDLKVSNCNVKPLLLVDI
ncbi:hypothetical protein [Methanobrevibacter sp.]|uniref:hypothetical protein n=1 Tax=Methanobrevibacter sp. TaxID=66852 RepID=UPI0025E24F3F|nr:hypothetical protein [Methanobrevibacter sp.]MBQ2961610.1 hypothetical protein [Methanobrevibacter sp.]